MSTAAWFGTPTQAELEEDAALIWPPIGPGDPPQQDVKQRAMRHVYFRAKWDGHCKECNAPFFVGDLVYRRRNKTVCEKCAS